MIEILLAMIIGLLSLTSDDAKAFFNPANFFQTMSQSARSVMNGQMPVDAMCQTPSEWVVAMCDSPAGAMGMESMHMAQNFARMTPMGGMFQNQLNHCLSRTMVAVLNDPWLTLKAVSCARNNGRVRQTMISTISYDPSLLHSMGQGMIYDRNVAHALLALANEHPEIGQLLLAHVDSFLFYQLSRVLNQTPSAVEPLALLASRHPDLAFRPGGAFYLASTDWRSKDNHQDGNEVPFEQFIRHIFSNTKAANNFMSAIGSVETRSRDIFLDAIFLGYVLQAIPNHEGAPEWATINHEYQSHQNLYALMKGLKTSLVVGPNQVDASTEKASANAKALMEGMMKYMITKGPSESCPRTHCVTRWGKAFSQVMIDGMYIHKDPDIMALGEFLQEIMPPDFSKSLQHYRPSESSPAPRIPQAI